jgi:hypothetical protein
MVHDGTPLVLAGITSWGGQLCADSFHPGVYTRLGAPAINSWVRGRRAELEIAASPAAPKAGDNVTFTATSDGAGSFSWDLDSDGAFDDAAGATAARTFAAEGTYRVALEAVDADGQPAERERTISVGAAEPPPPPPPADTGTGSTAAPPVPRPVGPLATILAFGRPKVRHGRFNIRVNFAAGAPAGIAVIEVFRGRRIIGIARTRVRRGGSKRVSVKLTPAGRRLLRRSVSGRIKVKVRVRVGHRVLGSKRLTIRR